MHRLFIACNFFVLFAVGAIVFTKHGLCSEFSWSFVEEIEKRQVQAGDANLELTIKSLAKVDSDWVKIGDVAKCKQESEECQDFLQIDIMESPEPGRKIKLPQAQLRRALLEENSNLDLDFGDLNYTEVVSLAHEITADEVRSSLDALLQTYSKNIPEIAVSVGALTLLKPWVVRPHEFRFEFVGLDKFFTGSSITLLQKQYQNRGRLEIKEMPFESMEALTKRLALVQLIFKKPVLIAKKSKKRGDKIKSNDFMLEMRQVRSNPENYPSKISAIDGYILKHPIAPGKTVRFTDIEKPFAIKKGQRVSMEVGSGSFVVTAKVRARQSGRTGDVIEVIYEPTKKKISAKVMGPNLLKQVNTL